MLVLASRRGTSKGKVEEEDAVEEERKVVEEKRSPYRPRTARGADNEEHVTSSAEE